MQSGIEHTCAAGRAASDCASSACARSRSAEWPPRDRHLARSLALAGNPSAWPEWVRPRCGCPGPGRAARWRNRSRGRSRRARRGWRRSAGWIADVAAPVTVGREQDREMGKEWPDDNQGWVDRVGTSTCPYTSRRVAAFFCYPSHQPKPSAKCTQQRQHQANAKIRTQITPINAPARCRAPRSRAARPDASSTGARRKGYAARRPQLRVAPPTQTGRVVRTRSDQIQWFDCILGQ